MNLNREEEVDFAVQYGNLLGSQNRPRESRTIVEDKNLLIDANDPMVVPGIDENSFIKMMAGGQSPSHEISRSTISKQE